MTTDSGRVHVVSRRDGAPHEDRNLHRGEVSWPDNDLISLARRLTRLGLRTVFACKRGIQSRLGGKRTHGRNGVHLRQSRDVLICAVEEPRERERPREVRGRQGGFKFFFFSKMILVLIRYKNVHAKEQ